MILWSRKKSTPQPIGRAGAIFISNCINQAVKYDFNFVLFCRWKGAELVRQMSPPEAAVGLYILGQDGIGIGVEGIAEGDNGIQGRV